MTGTKKNEGKMLLFLLPRVVNFKRMAHSNNLSAIHFSWTMCGSWNFIAFVVTKKFTLAKTKIPFAVIFLQQQTTCTEPTIVYTYQAQGVHSHVMPAKKLNNDKKISFWSHGINITPKKQIKTLDWTVWMVHSTQFGKVLAHAAWTKE